MVIAPNTSASTPQRIRLPRDVGRLERNLMITCELDDISLKWAMYGRPILKRAIRAV
jgi:hypothetical protein